MKYDNVADSGKAVEHFLNYLSQKPDDVQTKWLLNLAYMTMGKYPAGVPEKYLIPPSAFASKENAGMFTDVASSAGIDVVSMANGVIVDDFDNDGLLDVIISSYNVCEPLHYFHNNGDGTFTDRAAQAGLSDQVRRSQQFRPITTMTAAWISWCCAAHGEFRFAEVPATQRCDGTFTGNVTAAVSQHRRLAPKRQYGQILTMTVSSIFS